MGFGKYLAISFIINAVLLPLWYYENYVNIGFRNWGVWTFNPYGFALHEALWFWFLISVVSTVSLLILSLIHKWVNRIDED